MDQYSPAIDIPLTKNGINPPWHVKQSGGCGINILQFLSLIDDEGKRTEVGHQVMTKHNDDDFQSAFEEIIRSAYADLFEIRADDAWTMSRDDLIGYFRGADKTGEIIGTRQAGVFMALRELAGHERTQSAGSPKPNAATPGKGKAPAKKARPAASPQSQNATMNTKSPPGAGSKSDVALTVRIEINLPAEGTQETYDAIFKSIKANLIS